MVTRMSTVLSRQRSCLDVVESLPRRQERGQTGGLLPCEDTTLDGMQLSVSTLWSTRFKNVFKTLYFYNVLKRSLLYLMFVDQLNVEMGNPG